ncbi:MAG: TM2 domain-containing protein [Thermaerobacter sp.]|nr:TM2 domain-containing protein [Thermaerobacter sp.]
MSQETNVTVHVPKNITVAYVLWFFFGGLGIHRFYLGRAGTGLAMLALTVVGWITSFIFIGFLLLFAVFVWWVIDAFRIPSMVRSAAGFSSQITVTTTMAQPPDRSAPPEYPVQRAVPMSAPTSTVEPQSTDPEESDR